jgi:hypothetical protein
MEVEGLLLALKFSAWCLEVRMCENSCRSERRGKEKVMNGHFP